MAILGITVGWCRPLVNNWYVEQMVEGVDMPHGKVLILCLGDIGKRSGL